MSTSDKISLGIILFSTFVLAFGLTPHLGIRSGIAVSLSIGLIASVLYTFHER